MIGWNCVATTCRPSRWTCGMSVTMTGTKCPARAMDSFIPMTFTSFAGDTNWLPQVRKDIRKPSFPQLDPSHRAGFHSLTTGKASVRKTDTGRDRVAYWIWQGIHASSNEKGISALMTVFLDEEKGPHVCSPLAPSTRRTKVSCLCVWLDSCSPRTRRADILAAVRRYLDYPYRETKSIEPNEFPLASLRIPRRDRCRNSLVAIDCEHWESP